MLPSLLLAAALVALPALTTPDTAPADSRWWKTVYQDDFDGKRLTSRWSRYTGSPSSDPHTTWSRDRVRVEDGRLILDAVPRPDSPRDWFAGGVSNWRNALTYGRWTIRFRAPRSSILSFHFLLWPKADHWPPEIDLIEVWDPFRTKAYGYVHWLDGSAQRQRRTVGPIHRDLTRWRTVSVAWTPSKLTYRLDGKTFGTVRGAAVPQEPMWLALQSETQACDRSRSTCDADTTGTPRVEIDRVTVEKYVPRRTRPKGRR